jgi:hypothetical protein
VDPVLEPALWLGGPLVVAVLFGRFKKRLYWVSACVLFCFAAAIFYKVFHFKSVIYSADWTPVWVLLAWIEFVAIARWTGGFPIRGPLGPLSFLGGALLGDLGAALLLAPRAPTAKSKAQVVLTASAGALISPIGTPVTLLLVDPGSFGLLPFVLAAVSWPKGWAQDHPRRSVLPLTTTGATRNLWILLAVIAAMGLGWSPLWSLGLGCVALLIPSLRSGFKPPTPWGLELWLFAVALLCFLSLASGAFREIQEALVYFMGTESGWDSTLLVAGGALLSVVGTEEGATLVAHTVQQTGISRLDPATWTLIGAGVAMGGIGPLILVRAFRAGIAIWLAQLALVVVWANLMF